jgi:signal peptidase I
MSASSSTPEPARAADRRARVARAGLVALCFGVVPAAFSVVCAQYLVPEPYATPQATFYGWLSRVRSEHPVWVPLSLFLFAAVVVRYWAEQIPWLSARLALEPKTPARRAWILLGVGCAAAAVGGMGLRTFVVRSHRVVGTSMLPTLEPSALLAVNVLAHRSLLNEPKAPRRGDVVVFWNESSAPGPERLVKRVVGLPGDRIELKGGRPVVNGFELPRCTVGPYFRYVQGVPIYGQLSVEFLDDIAYLTLDGTGRGTPEFEGFTVPGGAVFVLGDQRDATVDSRTLHAGQSAGVPLDRIEGRVDRLLASERNPNAAWWSEVLKPVGLGFRMDGMDVQGVRATIEACLAKRPSKRRVPAAHALAQSSSNASNP